MAKYSLEYGNTVFCHTVMCRNKSIFFCKILNVYIVEIKNEKSIILQNFAQINIY